jgi:hypothetical protein
MKRINRKVEEVFEEKKGNKKKPSVETAEGLKS